jgi:uncharacterized protein (TIGR03437 family)
VSKYNRLPCSAAIAVFATVSNWNTLAGQSNPLLNVNPGSVALNYQMGTPPPVQTLTITSTGAPLTYRVSTTTASGGNWLFAGPLLAGSTPGTLTVGLNPSPIVGPASPYPPPGTYKGSVILTADGAANSPVTVPVTLNVTANTGPSLNVSPTSLTLNYQVGAPPPVQSLNITSTGAVLTYRVSTSTSSGGNWLFAGPLLAGSTPGTLTVGLNPSPIVGPASPYPPPGTYKGSVILTADGAANSPLSVPVTLNVTAAGGLLIATASPLATGTVGVAYSQHVSAAGGTAPYKSWAVLDPNDLPPGISLTSGDNQTAILTGTPTATGTFMFTVQVSDSTNATASARFSLTIGAGTVSILPNGIVNAASYAAESVSPGEIVTIFGSNLGPNALVGLQLDSRGCVSTSLAGTQVLFDGVAAPIIYTVAGQVGAIVPYGVNGKSSTRVQVDYQGKSSNGVSMPVAAVMPGIFTVDGSGHGPGAILNQDGTVNSASNPASVGTYIVVYCTGEGQTDPAGTDGKPDDSPAPVPAAQPVTARIGGIPIPVVQYAGGSPGLVAGVLQVNIQIPQGVPTGGSIPILINVGGQNSQANVTLGIK